MSKKSLAQKLDKITNFEIGELMQRNLDKYFRGKVQIDYNELHNMKQSWPHWFEDDFDMPPPYKEKLTKKIAEAIIDKYSVESADEVSGRNYLFEGFILSRADLYGLLMSAFYIGVQRTNQANFKLVEPL